MMRPGAAGLAARSGSAHGLGAGCAGAGLCQAQRQASPARFVS